MDSSKTNMDLSLLLLLPNNIKPNDGSYMVIESRNLVTQMLIIRKGYTEKT